MTRISSLDRFDRKLLSLVQHDADMATETLAEQVGLSASAVLRRLKRLKADRVILANVAVIDPLRVGKPTFFVVALEIERERPELIARLRQWLNADPHVQEVFYVTGSADFILIVAAPDVESYDALMSRLIAENPNVRRFTTNVALGVGKRSLAIPIEV
ncbi:MAG: Lrp/AsnC family transcriptional regulator [Pseudomonadota bacterium]|uniref:Lrp/AsnC family transcriptional regulator n=1 Tax=Sphingomonas sp. ERG5 TaxID=1381597 RepID=UPI00054C3EB8|nr:Lrp/AsnC family transcriptional regulator [Sphingomonas sp. ERG5]